MVDGVRNDMYVVVQLNLSFFDERLTVNDEMLQC